MPMVGVDWSQIGVTHLFGAIKVCNISSYVSGVHSIHIMLIG